MFKDLDRRRVLTALGTAALLPVAGIGSAAEQDEGEVEALEDLISEVLSSFVRMYEHHAAIEDTVIFPAWKAAIPKAQYEELRTIRGTRASHVRQGWL